MTPPIRVTRYVNPRAFVHAVESSLSATREWQNCLPIGIYNEYLSNTPPQPAPGISTDTGFTLLSTHAPESSEICLVAAQSPSYDFLGIFSAVPISPLDIAAHVAAIVDMLHVNGFPAAFNGDARLVDVVSAAVAKRRGSDARIFTEGEFVGAVVTPDTLSPVSSTMEMLPLAHEIRRVSYPTDEHYHNLLTGMHHDMFTEARGIDVPYDHSSKHVRDTVTRGDAWVYFVGGAPTASCYCGRSTRRGKCINVVYTRKDFRRNGYAERLVGEVCRRLFEELEYVMLFFQEGSSAAGIYRRLGFGGGEDREFLQKDVRHIILEQKTYV